VDAADQGPTGNSVQLNSLQNGAAMKLHEARILIVDDEPDLREIFAQQLKYFGYSKVRTAADGKAAIVAIQAEPIDLLISDTQMPVMDGITLVRRLHQLGIHAPIILFASGFGDVEVSEMYDLGAEAILAKPLRREEFLRCIERALADRSALWQDRMKSPPRQSLMTKVEAVNEGLGDGEDSGNILRLGRGGFSVQTRTPLRLGRVQFECALPNSFVDDGPHTLSGQGMVRWVHRDSHFVGIEFVYLDPSCRTWVANEIATRPTHSFIPGRGPARRAGALARSKS